MARRNQHQLTAQQAQQLNLMAHVFKRGLALAHLRARHLAIHHLQAHHIAQVAHIQGLQLILAKQRPVQLDQQHSLMVHVYSLVI